MVLYPLAAAGDVLRSYRDKVAALPDEAEAHAGLLTAPDGSGPICAVLLGYNGPMEEGERVLASLRSFGTPIADTVGPMSYGARQVMLDEPNAIHGLQRYWRSAFTEQLSDDFLRVLIDGAGSFTSPMSALLMFYLHGAMTRVSETATAFAARRPQWDIDVIGQWSDPTESPRHTGWVKDLWGKLEPHVRGSVYVNHLSVDDNPEMVRASFGANHAQLRQVKAAYDSNNLFRHNSNILPA
jgi:hypothetical protein